MITIPEIFKFEIITFYYNITWPYEASIKEGSQKIKFIKQ